MKEASQDKAQDIFEQWLITMGAKRVAQICKVWPMTVHHWRHRHCYPRIKQMQRIKRFTKGYITYDMMIDRKLVSPRRR